LRQQNESSSVQERHQWGCGRNSTPRRKAAKTQPDFFYYETRKPKIIEKISWFPGFLMELFLVAPLRLCVFALKVFCMMADCTVADRKVWPAARTGTKGQRPPQCQAGVGLASPAGTVTGAGGRFGGRNAARWKLASYEVAGHAFVMLVRPERTMDSAVPSGRILFWARTQTRCVWLISGCPFRTSGRVAGCKDWPDVRTGAKGRRPCKAGPGPDWPARPELGQAQT
jgi:hypothetical protein